MDSLFHGGKVESSSYLSPIYVPLQYSDGKLPSSNYVNMIILSVCSIDDVAYGMYDTFGYISIASEYGC